VERLPEIAWVDGDRVVAAGIEGAARGKRVVVPGPLVRLGSMGSRYAPHWLSNRVIERIFR
jgi:hypothetical protein